MRTWMLIGALGLAGCAAEDGGGSAPRRGVGAVVDGGSGGPARLDAGLRPDASGTAALGRDAATVADAAPIEPPCELGVTRACDPGLDACARGTQTCLPNTEFTAWGPCVNVTRPAEVCDNAIDDDCDGDVDEGCACLDGGDGTSPWQMARDARGLRCFGHDLDRDPAEFSFAAIPSAHDGAWRDRGALGIDFSDPSTISRDFCDGAHTGGVFTYFQTFIMLADPTGVGMRLQTGYVDDATQLKIFNARYPTGHVESAWYAFDAGMTCDLSRFLARGENRIVLTHLDDNPSSRTLSGVTISLDGTRLTTCPR